MEDICKSNNPTAAVEPSDAAVSKGSSLWRAFLVHSFPRGKE
jgi:hypothetical protein